jgi:ribonuclease E
VAAAAPAESVQSVATEESEFEPVQPGAPLGENGEHRRKRRRRRGRRGGRDRAERPQGEGTPQTGFAPEIDRFGDVPDEIDTTPRDGMHASVAPAMPIWPPKDDIDTTPSDEPPKPTKKGWWQRTFSGE